LHFESWPSQWYNYTVISNIATRWLAILFASASLLLATTIDSPRTFRTLVNFNGQNGSTPFMESLVQGTDGNLYGTTENGGANGFGSVFKMTPLGTLTTLYSFSNTTDGAYPTGGLILDNAGEFFFGTTSQGGANGLGTVFKITARGTLTTLHSFNGTDGAFPPSPCVEGSDLNFYGTTSQGGANNLGTVYQMTLDGVLTTLHSFNGTDGANPGAALTPQTGPDLTFYGTTVNGGTNGLGTIFQITSGGALMTLHSFNGTDGANPGAALTPQTNPSLIFYGTTANGGTDNLGTVFKITPDGVLTTLKSFIRTNGANPQAALQLQPNPGRNLYGTTANGGANSLGTIFKITPAGELTLLHNFDGTDGSNPEGGLVLRTSGVFFGVTSAGGSDGLGTAFSLSIGLGAFVEPLPTFGAVGASVIILGTQLTGATSVTFNGVAASFQVVSASEITTTVPTGATTGPVVVVTPNATLTSNVNFVVP